MFRLLSAPISVQWEVTSWCNLNCIHCYNHWIVSRCNTSQFDEHLFEKVVTTLLSHNVFAVTITGGEPLGVLDPLLPSIKELRKGGVEVGINSNCTLLDDACAEKLAKLGISSILVSLPSGNPDTHAQITGSPSAFQKTCQGIKTAIKHGIKPTINMVVSKLNIDEIRLTAEVSLGLGVRSFCATRASMPVGCTKFHEIALNKDEFQQMITQLIKIQEDLGMDVDSLEFYPPCSLAPGKPRKTFGSRTCTAGKTTCTIGSEGLIRPCSHAPQTYGSIQDGLTTAWQNMWEWRTDNWLPQECSDCNAAAKCQGGCKIEAMLISGNLNYPDPYCNLKNKPLETVRASSNMLNPQQTVFRINPNLRTRKEEFGGIAFSSLRRWVAVSKPLLAFLEKRKGGEITDEQIASALGVERMAVTNTIDLLVSKLILQ